MRLTQISSNFPIDENHENFPFEITPSSQHSTILHSNPHYEKAISFLQLFCNHNFSFIRSKLFSLKLSRSIWRSYKNEMKMK